MRLQVAEQADEAFTPFRLLKRHRGFKMRAVALRQVAIGYALSPLLIEQPDLAGLDLQGQVF